MYEVDKLYRDSLLWFPFGSTIYQTATDKSDWDFICVVADTSNYPSHVAGRSPICAFGEADVNVYKESEWKEKAARHDVDYVECMCMLKGEPKLDYDKIRDSFSHTASNSFVKAKKKLTVEKDFNPYIAKKSLWHSLRILMFGAQIMKTGHIYDFTEANYLYNDIVNCDSNDWEYYKEKYQCLYNKLHSEFKLAHKERMKIYGKE